MAKITYDVSNVEDGGGGGTGVQAPVAVYEAELAICEHRTEKKDGSPVNDLRCAWNVGEDYDWVFYYVQLDGSADWKLKQFTEALGLPPKGSFDADKLVGRRALVKVNAGSYGGEYRAQVGRVMAISDNGAAPAAAAEPEADDGPDTAGGTTAAGADDFVPAREGIDGVDSYDDWPGDDVLAECEDRGLTPKGRGEAAKVKSGIELLREDDASAAGGEDGATTDDYDTWTLEELVEEAKQRDLKLGRGKKTEEQVIAALREDDSTPF